MRVEIVEKLPQRAWKNRESSPESPSTRALQNFLAAVNGEDSLFVAEHAGAGGFREAGKSEETYAGDFAITFRSPEEAQNAGLHFSLVEKLTELFRAAGSSASLSLTLCLAKAPGRSKSGFTLSLRLESNGDSPEQAEMRWGLGLAHVQQGLMFAGRWLRQKQAAN